MRRKSIIIVLLLLGFSVLLTACNQRGFDGACAANPDFYQLDVEKMTGTDTHTLELNEGIRLKFILKPSAGNCTWKSKRRTARLFMRATEKKRPILPLIFP